MELVKNITSQMERKIRKKPIIRTSNGPIAALKINGQTKYTAPVGEYVITKVEAAHDEEVAGNAAVLYRKIPFGQTYSSDTAHTSVDNGLGNVSIDMTKTIPVPEQTLEDMNEEERNYQKEKEMFIRGIAPTVVIDEKDVNIVVILLALYLTAETTGYVDVEIEELIELTRDVVDNQFKRLISNYERGSEALKSVKMKLEEFYRLIDVRSGILKAISNLEKEQISETLLQDAANVASDPYYNDAEHLYLTNVPNTGYLNVQGTEYHEILRSGLRQTRSASVDLLDRYRTELVSTNKSLGDIYAQCIQLEQTVKNVYYSYQQDLVLVTHNLKSLENFIFILETSVPKMMQSIDSYSDYFRSFGKHLEKHRLSEITEQKKNYALMKEIEAEFLRLMEPADIMADPVIAERIEKIPGYLNKVLPKEKVKIDFLMFDEQLQKLQEKFTLKLKKEKSYLEEQKYKLQVIIFEILKISSNYAANAEGLTGKIKIANQLIEHSNLENLPYVTAAQAQIRDFNASTEEHLAKHKAMTDNLSNITKEIRAVEYRINVFEGVIQYYAKMRSDAAGLKESQFQFLAKAHERHVVAQRISNASELEARILLERHWKNNEQRASLLESQLGERMHVEYELPTMVDVDYIQPASITPSRDTPYVINNNERHHVFQTTYAKPVKATIEPLEL